MCHDAASDWSFVETTSLSAAKALKTHYTEQLKKERAANGAELDDLVESELVITTRDDANGKVFYRIRYA
jgi:hypothetical protein